MIMLTNYVVYLINMLRKRVLSYVKHMSYGYAYIPWITLTFRLTTMTEQQRRRRRRAAGGMRRTYIVIIIALLILGTVSTFALTYVQTELEEPWGAQYTLDYTGASIQLSNPETTIVDQDTIRVLFDITPDDKDVKCKFVITPLDINDDPIDAEGSSGRTTTVTWYSTGGGQHGQEQKQVDPGFDMEATITMATAGQIDNMRIEWVNDGFAAEYESVRILIEDVD